MCTTLTFCQKFKEISHAYDILSDLEKRRAYDLKSNTGFHRNTGGYSGQGYSYQHNGGTQHSRPRATTPPFPRPNPVSSRFLEIISLKQILLLLMFSYS